MTPVILLGQLQEFIGRETAGLLLPCRAVSEGAEPELRAANVYLMRLPRRDDAERVVPYLILSYLTGTDSQTPGTPAASECKIRITAAVYSRDGSEGAMNLLNLLTRVRIALLREGGVSVAPDGEKQFLIKSPLEMIVYPDNTEPYYLGEMITNWILPNIESEVVF
jgi:hypothetical protein